MGERSFVKLVPKTPKQMVLEQHTATLSRSFPSLPPGRRKALLFPFTPSISSERQDVLPGYIYLAGNNQIMLTISLSIHALSKWRPASVSSVHGEALI